MTNNLVIITGASRGFGRCLALEICSKLKGITNMYLLARSLDGLEETKDSILLKIKDMKHICINIYTISIDLENLESFEQIINNKIFNQIDPADIYYGLLIHNAGSLGDLGNVQNINKIKLIPSYFNANLTSVIWLNKKFLEYFSENMNDISESESFSKEVEIESRGSNKDILNKNNLIQTKELSPFTIVNISSLTATKPFHTMNFYCTGKAARLMHHLVIAKEQEFSNKIKILNYSPGPMDTNMQKVLRESKDYYRPAQNSFKKMHSENRYVSLEASAKRCTDLILSQNYKSGDHIDYFD